MNSHLVVDAVFARRGGAPRKLDRRELRWCERLLTSTTHTIPLEALVWARFLWAHQRSLFSDGLRLSKISPVTGTETGQGADAGKTALARSLTAIYLVNRAAARLTRGL